VTDSVESLQAAHAALFVERELLLYGALWEVWRQPERRLELRLSAMAAIGAMRIALERWEQPSNKRTLPKIFTETIDALGLLQIDGRA
jgi:hypothetical protein